MAWWLWITIGIALVLAEVLTPGGLVFLFFGAAAVLVGLFVGAVPSLALWAQILAFSISAIGMLAAFRRPMLRRLERAQPGKPVDTLVSEAGIALDAMAPGAVGRVELRGTTWKAVNAGTEPLPAGAAVQVARVDELTLHVTRR